MGAFTVPAGLGPVAADGHAAPAPSAGFAGVAEQPPASAAVALG